MNSIVHPGLSPNVESDDLRLAHRLWWMPVRDEEAVRSLEQAIAMEAECHVIATSCGRSALDLILDAYGIQKGDRVALAAFTCVAVPGPLVQRGIRLIYLDIDREFRFMEQAMDELKQAAPKALIIQDLFAFPIAKQPLIDWCRAQGILTIEDAAHGAGIMIDGKMLGTFCDVGFTSFGRDKMLSSVFGGAIFSSSSEIADKIRTLRDALPQLSSSHLRRILLQPIITTIARHYYHHFGHLLLACARKFRLLPLAVEPQEKIGKASSMQRVRMHPSLAVMALHQWKKRMRMEEHRREVVAIYENAFHTYGRTLALLRYPLLVRDRRFVKKELKKIGVIAGDWYESPIAPEGVLYSMVFYEQKMCPMVEYMCSSMINLPTHAHTSPEIARKIVQIVQPYVQT